MTDFQTGQLLGDCDQRSPGLIYFVRVYRTPLKLDLKNETTRRGAWRLLARTGPQPWVMSPHRPNARAVIVSCLGRSKLPVLSVWASLKRLHAVPRVRVRLCPAGSIPEAREDRPCMSMLLTLSYLFL